MVLTLILSINSMHFIGLGKYNVNTTIMNCLQIPEITSALTLIEIFVEFYVPYVIMVCLDVMVIKRLRQSRQRSGLNSQRQHSNQTTDRSVRFTITTILIDLIYFVFNFPITLSKAHFIVTILFTNIKGNTISETLEHLSLLLSLSYSAVLFFLFLIFNRIFRKEFIDVFRLGKLAEILPFRGLSFNFFFSTNNSERTQN